MDKKKIKKKKKQKERKKKLKGEEYRRDWRLGRRGWGREKSEEKYLRLRKRGLSCNGNKGEKKKKIDLNNLYQCKRKNKILFYSSWLLCTVTEKLRACLDEESFEWYHSVFCFHHPNYVGPTAQLLFGLVLNHRSHHSKLSKSGCEWPKLKTGFSCFQFLKNE